MVKKGLTISFKKTKTEDANQQRFTLAITNTGAAHYIPTGTPDRHLTVQLRALNKQGKVLKEEKHTLKRTVMWRPFIVDLWDTRLPPKKTREYTIEIESDITDEITMVDAQVHYHLLDESRRQHINYQNKEPIHYPVFEQQLTTH